jgi:hypothetical protein
MDLALINGGKSHPSAMARALDAQAETRACAKDAALEACARLSDAAEALRDLCALEAALPPAVAEAARRLAAALPFDAARMSAAIRGGGRIR